MRKGNMRARFAGLAATLLLVGAAMSTDDTYSQESDADHWKELLAGEGLTGQHQQQLSAAFEILTPLQRTILRKHLRAISVVEELPNNAWTMFDPADPELTFRLIINAAVLNETLSGFATRKERQLFAAARSPLTVTVVAGSMDAVAFVLLHEATHMVDIALGLSATTAAVDPIVDGREAPFARGIWETPTTPVGAYRGDNLEAIPWRTGKPLDVATAPALYAELGRTPFASVYASVSVAEDLAELVAWWQMTELHGQPYRIELRVGDELIQSFEPMKSALVRSRLSQLARFDSTEIERVMR